MSSPSARMMEEDEDEDMAARAYASIAAQLQQFTSPKLGSLPPKSTYDDSIMSMEDDDEDMDTVDWMKRDLQHPSPRHPFTPKRTTPILERADTPVMSNSSSKRQSPDRSPGMKEPIQTPGYQVIPRPKVHSPRTVSAPGVLGTRSHHPNQSPFVYRRYHDTLWSYLKAKRSLSHSLDLERKGQALEAMTLDDAGFTASSLASREQRTELDYLSQLQQLCWSTPSPETFLEGDCWMLLVTLRQLGLSALVWDNDAVSAAQHARAQTGFLQQLANLIEETPSQLLQRLASNQAPLALQRRYSILQWIQTCLDQVRVPPKTVSALRDAAVSHPDDTETPSLVPEALQQQMLLASLSYILAGRLEDAKALARSNGQPWRAAAWGGGQALGYVKKPNPETQTMDVQPTGNPNRFLWKRQVWKNGRRLGSASSGSATVEAAISALLANDVPTCLVNPHLRTWSQALGATFMGMWGRLEDEVLHLHNTQRRNHAKYLPFPGTQNATQESEQLMATAQLAGMTDLQALQLLSSSPFEEIRGQGSYEGAIAAFCVGKSTILDFLYNETEQVLTGQQESDAELAQLRFLTHLVLFLDSLQVSTTPIVLDGLTEQKNQVLFRYVQYLESRPDLWHLVTLYVSLLPDEKLLEWYPTMLAKVLEDTERQAMLESMQSLFPHLQVLVLRQTVRLCLSFMDASDDMKCRSIRWLLYDENHAGEALICSNILLRELFLENDDEKIEVAMSLVEDNLPEDLVDRAELSLNEESKEDKATNIIKVTNARTEHLAFLSYLDAYRSFGKWKDTLADTPTIIADSLGKQVDFNNLNATEQQIATQRMRRDWAREKNKHFETLLDAAEHARKVLHGVLTHPGGWLALDQEDGARMVVDDEEQKRRKDMQVIRSRYLVLAVNLYHQVCEETALWMSRSLDDAMHIMTRDEALKSLQDRSYQPDVWYQYALELAIVIADDRYGIQKALGPNALKDIVTKLAETAVSKLMSAS